MLKIEAGKTDINDLDIALIGRRADIWLRASMRVRMDRIERLVSSGKQETWGLAQRIPGNQMEMGYVPGLTARYLNVDEAEYYEEIANFWKEGAARPIGKAPALPAVMETLTEVRKNFTTPSFTWQLDVSGIYLSSYFLGGAEGWYITRKVPEGVRL